MSSHDTFKGLRADNFSPFKADPGGGVVNGFWCLRDGEDIHILRGRTLVEIDGCLLVECVDCNAFVPFAVHVANIAIFQGMNEARKASKLTIDDEGDT